ncbi:hypothetical protein B0H15DRAFT_952535 [Mycena belliarum]|uniref:Uncharacterized protein n=1 Tax=Mycena belliarum TaxID=1033014 RepID=A0AAD6U080_9AGAR|nr:hypothetical protein B0H15DRAFT_952535 [Mycena belliae]
MKHGGPIRRSSAPPTARRKPAGGRRLRTTRRTRHTTSAPVGISRGTKHGGLHACTPCAPLPAPSQLVLDAVYRSQDEPLREDDAFAQSDSSMVRSSAHALITASESPECLTTRALESRVKASPCPLSAPRLAPRSPSFHLQHRHLCRLCRALKISGSQSSSPVCVSGRSPRTPHTALGEPRSARRATEGRTRGQCDGRNNEEKQEVESRKKEGFRDVTMGTLRRRRRRARRARRVRRRSSVCRLLRAPHHASPPPPSTPPQTPALTARFPPTRAPPPRPRAPPSLSVGRRSSAGPPCSSSPAVLASPRATAPTAPSTLHGYRGGTLRGRATGRTMQRNSDDENLTYVLRRTCTTRAHSSTHA